MRSNVFLYGFVLVGFVVFAGTSRSDMVWDPDSGWLAEDERSSSEKVVTVEAEQGNTQPPEAPQPQSAEQPYRSGEETSANSGAKPAAVSFLICSGVGFTPWRGLATSSTLIQLASETKAVV